MGTIVAWIVAADILLRRTKRFKHRPTVTTFAVLEALFGHPMQAVISFSPEYALEAPTNGAGGYSFHFDLRNSRVAPCFHCTILHNGRSAEEMCPPMFRLSHLGESDGMFSIKLRSHNLRNSRSIGKERYPWTISLARVLKDSDLRESTRP